MKLKPMADNVLLKAHEAQESTASGILLATSNKEKPAMYEVVSVGPGTKDVTMTVSVGDKVVVGKFTGTDLSSRTTFWLSSLTEEVMRYGKDDRLRRGSSQEAAVRH